MADPSFCGGVCNGSLTVVKEMTLMEKHVTLFTGKEVTLGARLGIELVVCKAENSRIFGQSDALFTNDIVNAFLVNDAFTRVGDRDHLFGGVEQGCVRLPLFVADKGKSLADYFGFPPDGLAEYFNIFHGCKPFMFLIEC